MRWCSWPRDASSYITAQTLNVNGGFISDGRGQDLLIISGGIEAADAAKRAKEMGHTVVVSDRDPEAPGFAFADSCLIADVYGAGGNRRRGRTL